MNIPSITEAMIRQLDVDPTVYERGRSYFNGGMVLDIVQRGKVIAADVQGSEDEPYAVAVVLSAHLRGDGSISPVCKRRRAAAAQKSRCLPIFRAALIKAKIPPLRIPQLHPRSARHRR